MLSLSNDRAYLTESLALARTHGDAHTVILLAQALRLHHPDAVEGYGHAVTSLRQLGHSAEAAAIAKLAADRFADEKWPWIDLYTSANARNDMLDLATISARMRSRFADWADGYALGALALRQLGRFDEAAAVAQDAIRLFPDQAWPFVDAGMVARARGDESTALQFAADVKARFPDEQGGHALAIVALRCIGQYEEAAEAAKIAIERFATTAWPYQEMAIILRQLGRIADIEALAEETITAFPNEAWPVKDRAIVLQEQGRFEDAENVLLEGLERFPTDRYILENLARIANLRRNPERADEYYEMAMRVFPDDTSLAMAYALRPSEFDEERGKGGGTKTLARLEALHARFPEFEEAYVIHAESLIHSGRLDEAESLLVNCGVKLNEHQRLCLVWGDVAVARGHFAEGEERLRTYRAAFPMMADGYLRLAKLLARMGRGEEADVLCFEAIKRFPTSREIYITYALVAQFSGRFRLAVDRWHEGQVHFPGDIAFRAGAHEAELAVVDDHDHHDASAPANVQHQSKIEDGLLDPLSLMMKFQNVGGPTHGCEFGSVQRHFGAEPLGLLRWVALTPSSLVKVLDDDFKGLWSGEDVRVSLAATTPSRPGDREYMLFFHGYELHMHTFRYMSELSEVELLATFTKRLKFLARKFAEDLGGGDTILVYKQDLLEISDHDIDDVLRSLARHGSQNTLLFVRQATDEHPAGTVELTKPGLITGYIDGFIISPDGYERPIRYDTWLNICQSAYALWQTLRPAAAVEVTEPTEQIGA